MHEDVNGDLDTAIADFDAVLAREGESTALGARRRVAYAMLQKAHALAGLGRLEDEAECCDEVLARSEGASDPYMRDAWMRATYHKACVRREQGRRDEAVEIVAELINSSFDTATAESAHLIVGAVMMAAEYAGDSGQPDAAVHLYDRLIEGYGHADAPDGKRTAVNAMQNKAVTLRMAGRFGQAAEVWDDLLIRLGQPTDAELRVIGARALCSRGYCRDQCGSHSDALADYGAVIDRYGEGEDPRIDAQLGYARRGVAGGYRPE